MLIEMYSKFETSLINSCGKANVDNPFITAGLRRSEVKAVHDDEERVTMEYKMKPYKPIVPDNEKVFNVDIQAVPLTAEALQAKSDALYLQFQSISTCLTQLSSSSHPILILILILISSHPHLIPSSSSSLYQIINDQRDSMMIITSLTCQ